MIKAKRSPASGELAAIGGYQKQYEYSACTLYRLMQDGSLEAITVVDEDAGLFDDLVIHSKGEVHATQIKTQKDAKPIVLATKLASNSLIRDMAASWLSIENKYGSGSAKLRYIFAGYFSTSDQSLANTGSTGAKHSTEFARFVSRDDKDENTLENSIWSNKLQELQILSGLDHKQFVQFLSCLELCDRSELERNKIENFQPDDRQRIESIKSLIPTLVGEATSKRRWTETELVIKLGWRTKLSQKNVHEFPVPEDFQENEVTESVLLKAIHDHTSGYISLIGPPGTGKSTTLQRAIFSTAEYSVSRYLAFIPNQRHGLGRAEAGEFLNDLIVELRSQGFTSSRYALDDLAGLRTELARQLDQASQRYQETGRKTVIVIDGLDHVPREENPVSSFLKQLPASNAVPAGVLFVLGTQSLDLNDLHPTIVQQAKLQDRSIAITPLSRAAIFLMSDTAGVPAFIEREVIYDACAGHPLSARYFIEALKNVTSKDDARRILSHPDGLGGSLEEIYQRVWLKLGTSENSTKVLGLLARTDGDLLPHQLACASSDAAVEDVINKAGFLLSNSEAGRLSIFHNSFRLFVAAETRKRFGHPDHQLDKDYNQALAQIAADAPTDDPQHWMELRYRARSGDNDAVLRIGTPKYFRDSLAAFRPSSEIYSDLRLTYAAVKLTRNRVTLLNKLFIEKEIGYRLEAVSELDLIGLFLDLGNVELATKHALEGRGSGDGWLRLTDFLWKKGRLALARQVFEANEPLEILFGHDGLDPNQDLSQVLDWIEQAQRFRSAERLVSIVESIPINSRFSDGGTGDRVRGNLRYRLARGRIGDELTTDIGALRTNFSLKNSDVVRLAIEAAEQAFQVGNNEAALIRLREAESFKEILGLDDSWRRAASVLAMKLGAIDIATRLTSTLSVPFFDEDRLAPEENSVEYRCQAIFDTIVLSELLKVPVSQQSRTKRHEPSVLLNYVEAKIRELALLRAKAEGNDPSQVLLSLRTIIQFFARAKAENGDFSGHKFYPVLGWLANTIVHIANRLGEKSLAELVAFVDEIVVQNDNNLSSSQTFRLRFASAIFAIDGDTERARGRIDAAQNAARFDRTPQEVVEFRAEFARAFSGIGLEYQAQESLMSMHRDTFGYWLRAKKEPQYEFWAWSYLQACDSAPARTEKNALEFARFILGMDETEGDETAQRLIGDLLCGAASSAPATAGIITRLIESNLTNWAKLSDSALAAITKHDPALATPALLAFSRMVVPFFEGSCDQCISTSLTALRADERGPVVQVLVEAISKWCPPSQRTGILELIRKSAPEADVALGTALDQANKITDSLNRLSYGEGKSSEPSFSKEYIATSLHELIKEGEGKSDYEDGVDYSYARAAESLTAASTKVEIESFIVARPHLEKDAKFLVACARAMLRLGENSAARAFFQKAEKAAFTGHWSSFMGGQKLELQDLRIELDGNAGRERGFDVLVDELATGQTFGSSLFLNLDRVLEQVSVEKPYEAFWLETEDHLKQYREYGLAKEVVPKPDIADQSALLAFVIAQAFDFSCPELLDHARAAAKLVASWKTSSPIIKKLLMLLRSQADGPREAAALMYRLRVIPHLKETLVREAREALSHGDFIVSNQAKLVLMYFGERPEEQDPVALPPFYSLAPSGSPLATDFKPPPGLMTTQRRVWVDDPWTWTSMMEFPFRVVADGSDIELEVLRRRCADFMRREGGRDAFGPDTEDAILARLRRMDLAFPYRRSLPMAANRAFGMMLQELALAQEVDPRVFPTVWEEIGGPSLSGFNLDLEQRPSWLEHPVVPRRQNGGVEHDEWLSTAENCLYSPLVTGHFVLVEKTIFKARIWRDTVESARLCLPKAMNVDSGLSGVPRLISLDDRRPRYKENESKLVCQIPESTFGDLRKSTMTICPYVAMALGWTCSKTNPFELHDSTGEIVAKTIRWVDGTDKVDHSWSELYFAGQVIILSGSGRVQLEGLRGPIQRGVKVTRKVLPEQGEILQRIVTAKPA